MLLALALTALLCAPSLSARAEPNAPARDPSVSELPDNLAQLLPNTYTIKVKKNASTILELKDGASLYVPRGALPAGIRITARYITAPKVKGSYTAAGRSIKFKLSKKAKFKKALELRSPVPTSDVAEGRFDLYKTAYLSKGRWKVVASGYDPVKGVAFTPMTHFSVWSRVTTIVEVTKALIECGAKAAGSAAGTVFLRCLAPKGIEIAGNELAASILERLLPKTCWAALVIADMTSGGKIIGTILGLLGVILSDPACTGKAGDPVLAIPRITAVSPSRGPNTGGGTVTISGNYLFLVQRVTFGGVPATDVRSYMNDASHITARVPAHSAGTVNVVVTTSGGTTSFSSGSQYTYQNPGSEGGSPAPPVPSVSARIGIDWSSSHPGWISLRLDGFPTGAYTYTCRFASGGDQSFTLNVTAQPQTFDNGRTCFDQIASDTVRVSIAGFDSNTITVGLPLPGSPTGADHIEVAGGSAATWTNYLNAGGIKGATIASQAHVAVSCKIEGFRVADGNTWWYQIAEAPWSGRYYVSADAFYNNGATTGPLSGTPFVDPSVPNCVITTNPPGRTETTGGVTHTWTNYLNAGGTQGPSIPAFASVEIACKLQGFVVANGNPWWYRVASAPWSSAYYASADAFYNNGSTGGPLQGTPYVDPAVPDC